MKDDFPMKIKLLSLIGISFFAFFLFSEARAGENPACNKLLNSLTGEYALKSSDGTDAGSVTIGDPTSSTKSLALGTKQFKVTFSSAPDKPQIFFLQVDQKSACLINLVDPNNPSVVAQSFYLDSDEPKTSATGRKITIKRDASENEDEAVLVLTRKEQNH